MFLWLNKVAMIKNVPLIILSLICIQAFSRQDTTAYHQQRIKINTLLAERSRKFGQYDESLAKRSGIFGLQTKKDLKNSNKILQDIAITDNQIFQELKVLLDYKDIQYQQSATQTNDVDIRMSNYMRTIKNLQNQNAQLKENLDQHSKHKNITAYVMAFFILIMAGGGYFMYKHSKERT